MYSPAGVENIQKQAQPLLSQDLSIEWSMERAASVQLSPP